MTHRTLEGSAKPRIIHPAARMKVTAKMWALAWPAADRTDARCRGCGEPTRVGGLVAFIPDTDTPHKCPGPA